MMGGYSTTVEESIPVFVLPERWILQQANRQTIWQNLSEHWSLELAIQAAALILGFNENLVLRIQNSRDFKIEWESSNIQDFQKAQASQTSIQGAIGIRGLT